MLSVIANSCIALGLHATFKELCPWATPFDIDDEKFDKKFDTNTTERISNSDLRIADPNATRSATLYRTAPERFVHFIIKRLDIDFQDFDFVDVGCGKGRVLLIASDYPFRTIRGIELSKRAYDVAKHNLQIYHSVTQKCSDISIANIDARKIVPERNNTIYYLFEPFKFPFLIAVLSNISKTLKNQRKIVKVVCIWSDLTEALPFIDEIGFDVVKQQNMIKEELNYWILTLRNI